MLLAVGASALATQFLNLRLQQTAQSPSTKDLFRLEQRQWLRGLEPRWLPRVVSLTPPLHHSGAAYILRGLPSPGPSAAYGWRAYFDTM